MTCWYVCVSDPLGQPLPPWFQTLQQLGLADVDVKAQAVTLGAISFRRDGALYALPIAAGFPVTIAYLALAGALAASLAAISNAVMALGAILAEDAVGAAHSGQAGDGPRVLKARIGIAAAVVAGSWIALLPADPLKLALYALAFSAASAFPVLVLAVLWKRMTVSGALAAMTSGLGVAVLAALASELGIAELAPPLAGALGMAAAFAAGFGVSLAAAPPSRHVLEYVRDMRVPGGETLYDREQRLARRGQPRSG